MSKQKQDEVKQPAAPPAVEQPDVDTQLAQAALEEKQLDLEIKRHNVQKMQQEKETRTRANVSKVQGLKDFNASLRSDTVRCNHRKGGVDGGGRLLLLHD